MHTVRAVSACLFYGSISSSFSQKTRGKDGLMMMHVFFSPLELFKIIHRPVVYSREIFKEKIDKKNDDDDDDVPLNLLLTQAVQSSSRSSSLNSRECPEWLG